jgi:hypothetical protein
VMPSHGHGVPNPAQADGGPCIRYIASARKAEEEKSSSASGVDWYPIDPTAWPASSPLRAPGLSIREKTTILRMTPAAKSRRRPVPRVQGAVPSLILRCIRSRWRMTATVRYSQQERGL